MLPFILGALFGWLLVYVLYPFLKQRLLYHPISRSCHIRPTPCGGGISFVLVSFVCSFIALLDGEGFHAVALPLLSFPLAVVGLYDDLCSLPKSWRYVVHLSTGAFILGITPLVHQIFSASFPVILICLTIFFC